MTRQPESQVLNILFFGGTGETDEQRELARTLAALHKMAGSRDLGVAIALNNRVIRGVRQIGMRLSVHRNEEGRPEIGGGFVVVETDDAESRLVPLLTLALQRLIARTEPVPVTTSDAYLKSKVVAWLN